MSFEELDIQSNTVQPIQTPPYIPIPLISQLPAGKIGWATQPWFDITELDFLAYWRDGYPSMPELSKIEYSKIFKEWLANIPSHVNFVVPNLFHKLETKWDGATDRLYYIRPVIPDTIKSVALITPESLKANKGNNALNEPVRAPKYVDSQAYLDILQPFKNAQATLKKADSDMSELVPSIKSQYRPFGCYSEVLTIIKSGNFFPTYIVGETGYGKTTAIEQACAVAGREFIRTNITSETDKTSLLVIPQLVNGNLEYLDGPVLEAMKKGAILLLDEIDRGTEKLMCLQGILEGRPYYNERKGEMVHPQPGFNVFGTGNSKGQGGDARYIVNILDDALLDRFQVMFVQDPPTKDVEEEILTEHFASKKFVLNDRALIPTLVRWAERTRKNFQEEETETAISTRRLLAICDAYVMFGKKKRAIQLCLNRLPDQTQKSFMELWESMDTDVLKEQEAEGVTDIWKNNE